MLWVLDAGLSKPAVNQPIFDLAGHLLGIADLLDSVAGTVTEFDGGDHRRLDRHTEDNAREERFERHNLTVVRVTDLDLRRKRQRSVARLRDGHRRGMTLDRVKDRWTIEPPSWWSNATFLDRE